MNNEQIDTSNDDTIIESALKILENRISYNVDAPILTSPVDSMNYVKLKLSEYEHEVFACLFLDNRHHVIHYEEMFRGTINGASVHPREVVKTSLAYNAAAVIFSHNHPSGIAEPSEADRQLTNRLKDALALVDIRVLDHLVVGDEVVSFAERGFI